MTRSRFSIPLLLGFSLAGCVHWQAVQIPSSDPNLAAQQRNDAAFDADTARAFIVNHPELDAQTKKDLRDGTITVHEAQERLKKQRSLPQ